MNKSFGAFLFNGIFRLFGLSTVTWLIVLINAQFAGEMIDYKNCTPHLI